jgi:hypothetical protein
MPNTVMPRTLVPPITRPSPADVRRWLGKAGRR